MHFFFAFNVSEKKNPKLHKYERENGVKIIEAFEKTIEWTSSLIELKKIFKFYDKSTYVISVPVDRGSRKRRTASLQRCKIPTPKDCPEYDTSDDVTPVRKVWGMWNTFT